MMLKEGLPINEVVLDKIQKHDHTKMYVCQSHEIHWNN